MTDPIDTSHLDLSRFRRVTRGEYALTDWKITREEMNFARELHELTAYDRHCRCHDYAKQKKDRRASEAWNLWACAYPILKPDDAEKSAKRGVSAAWSDSAPGEIKEQYEIDPEENKGLLFFFLSDDIDMTEDLRFTVDYLDCSYFLFPDHADFRWIRMMDQAKFIEAVFLKSAEFEETEFHHGANFDRASFFGNASFKDVQFMDYTIFNGVYFHGSVDFSGSRFSEGGK